MANLGGFIHRSETADFVWSTKDFCIIRATMGFTDDPNFKANWQKVGQVRKMIYCNPEVTDKVKVYDNASKLVEAIHNLQAWYGQFWREQPLVVNITNPAITLEWVCTFVFYFFDNDVLKVTDPKILLYTTKKKWDSILIDTPDGEAKLTQLLNKAEPFVSDYENSQPVLPLKVGKIHYREYSQGKAEYSESGVFQVPGYLFGGTTDPGTPDPGDPDIPVTSGFIHMQCPYCKKTIF